MSKVAHVISIADRSTKALVTASAGLTKVATELAALAQTTVVLSQEIEFKQSDLTALEAEFDTQFRTKVAELKLKVIENEDSVLNSLMKSRGFVAITGADLSELHNELAAAQDNNEQAISDAVTKAYSTANADHKTKLSQVEADHRVQIAELNADSKADRSRIEFLEQQNKQLQAQLDAERETRLEIAKADSQRQGVVVNAGKQ